MSRTVIIKGMSDPESVVKVSTVLRGLHGLEICSVEPGMIVVEGITENAQIIDSIKQTGFQVLEIV